MLNVEAPGVIQRIHSGLAPRRMHFAIHPLGFRMLATAELPHTLLERLMRGGASQLRARSVGCIKRRPRLTSSTVWAFRLMPGRFE